VKQLLVLGLALVLVFLLGGAVGRVLAIGLLPQLFQPRDASGATPNGLRDALQALAAGLVVAALCQWAWAPALITEGHTTGSDVAEHFWLLHSLRNPGWQHWSMNRYPLPALFAHVFAFTGNPHASWYCAAAASMVGMGAGLWLWGRAVAGPVLGWCAALLVGAFPDLVLLTRTVTAYPEIIALGCLASGLTAYALRSPGPTSCLWAGLGCAAVFASDSRGLVQGSVLLPLALLAALSTTGGLRRRAACLLLLLLPIYGSWMAYNRLPLTLHSLEQTLEGPIERSYTRLGQTPPTDILAPTGWTWGASTPQEAPASFQALLGVQARMNPAIYDSNLQRQLAAEHLQPLLWPLVVLSLCGLLFITGPPPRGLRDHGAAWWAWLDWRGRLALLALLPYLAWSQSAYELEYTSRFFAQAAPGLALLAAMGLAALAGAHRRSWLCLVPVLLLVMAVPNRLNAWAGWHTPRAAQKELQLCLVAIQNGASAQSPGEPVPPLDIYECIKAQSRPLGWGPRWPW